MSKQVLKELLDSFDSALPNASDKPAGKTAKLKSGAATATTSGQKRKTAKKKGKKNSGQRSDSVSPIELYKAFRASHAKHVPNLSSMKRRFFKHNPDKPPNKGNANKTQKSIFTDKDFANIL